MDRLAEVIKSLSTQNLSEKEKEAGATRNIKIIVWAAHCEVETFYHGGLDLASLCPTLELWDFQIWYPFCARFHDKTEEVPRTGAERAFGSLGALGSGLPLHNGCNDTVAQLLAFLRFMLMTEAEWSSWFDRKADLAPISFNWVDPAIYERNMALAPPPNPRVTAMYKGKGGKGKGKGKQGNRKIQTQKTTSEEQSNVEAASSSYPGPEVLIDNTADLNIDLGPQSPVGNSTTSESSGTGWPEGIDSMSDWSPSSKPSSGDDNGSGWPVGIDYVEENDGHTCFEVTDRNGDAPANNVTDPASWDSSRSGRRRNRRARRKRSESVDSFGSVVSVEWAL